MATVIKVCFSCDFVENLPENRTHCIQCGHGGLCYWENIQNFKGYISLYPEIAVDLRFINSQLQKAYDDVMFELESKTT